MTRTMPTITASPIPSRISRAMTASPIPSRISRAMTARTDQPTHFPAPPLTGERDPFHCKVSRVQALFGLSRATVYRLSKAGKIKLRKVGRATLVDVQSVRDHLAGSALVHGEAA